MKAISKLNLPNQDPIVINLKFVSVNKEMQIKLIKYNEIGTFQIKKELSNLIISLKTIFNLIKKVPFFISDINDIIDCLTRKKYYTYPISNAMAISIMGTPIIFQQ